MTKHMKTLANILGATENGLEVDAYDSLDSIIQCHSMGTITVDDPIGLFCIVKWGCRIGDPFPLDKLKQLEFIISLVQMEDSRWCITGIEEAPEREEPGQFIG